MVIEAIVPALDIIVCPDRLEECAPLVRRPKGALHPRVSDVGAELLQRRCRCLSFNLLEHRRNVLMG